MRSALIVCCPGRWTSNRHAAEQYALAADGDEECMGLSSGGTRALQPLIRARMLHRYTRPGHPPDHQLPCSAELARGLLDTLGCTTAAADKDLVCDFV